jgi:hypothetical protein
MHHNKKNAITKHSLPAYSGYHFIVMGPANRIPVKQKNYNIIKRPYPIKYKYKIQSRIRIQNKSWNTYDEKKRADQRSYSSLKPIEMR